MKFKLMNFCSSLHCPSPDLPFGVLIVSAVTLVDQSVVVFL